MAAKERNTSHIKGNSFGSISTLSLRYGWRKNSTVALIKPTNYLKGLGSPLTADQAAVRPSGKKATFEDRFQEGQATLLRRNDNVPQQHKNEPNAVVLEGTMYEAETRAEEERYRQVVTGTAAVLDPRSTAPSPDGPGSRQSALSAIFPSTDASDTTSSFEAAASSSPEASGPEEAAASSSPETRVPEEVTASNETDAASDDGIAKNFNSDAGGKEETVDSALSGPKTGSQADADFGALSSLETMNRMDFSALISSRANFNVRPSSGADFRICSSLEADSDVTSISMNGSHARDCSSSYQEAGDQEVYASLMEGLAKRDPVPGHTAKWLISLSGPGDPSGPNGPPLKGHHIYGQRQLIIIRYDTLAYLAVRNDAAGSIEAEVAVDPRELKAGDTGQPNELLDIDSSLGKVLDMQGATLDGVDVLGGLTTKLRFRDQDKGGMDNLARVLTPEASLVVHITLRMKTLEQQINFKCGIKAPLDSNKNRTGVCCQIGETGLAHHVLKEDGEARANRVEEWPNTKFGAIESYDNQIMHSVHRLKEQMRTNAKGRRAEVHANLMESLTKRDPVPGQGHTAKWLMGPRSPRGPNGPGDPGGPKGPSGPNGPKKDPNGPLMGLLSPDQTGTIAPAPIPKIETAVFAWVQGPLLKGKIIAIWRCANHKFARMHPEEERVPEDGEVIAVWGGELRPEEAAASSSPATSGPEEATASSSPATSGPEEATATG